MKKSLTGLVVAGKNPVDTSRRQFIKKTAAATVVAAAGPVVLRKYARAAARTIKIGFVSPLTGVLAAFAEGDNFVLSGVRKLVSGGIMVNGVNHPVEIIEKDSQSDPNRSAEVATSLIKADNVDLLLSSSHRDTITPVSSQAEINGVPCITTDCPWESWFFGSQGDPKKGFKWAYHFFWGVQDDVAVVLDIWNSLPTNKVVGALWPDNASGIAYANPQTGYPKPILAAGFKLVDPGRFPVSIPDFSSLIHTFKQEQVEIVNGILTSSVFADFWSQAAQQGFKPKIVTISAALLFPAAVNALGDHGVGLTTEDYWSPGFSFKSGLTGQSAAQMCAQWEKETGKQWSQPIGPKHALFEVALDVLKRTKNIDSPESILDAITTTNYNSIAGHIQWTGQPLKNVCRTPLCGGQWVRGKNFKYDLIVVSNKLAPEIPKQAPEIAVAG